MKAGDIAVLHDRDGHFNIGVADYTDKVVTHQVTSRGGAWFQVLGRQDGCFLWEVGDEVEYQ